jgi:hypothetical protein
VLVLELFGYHSKNWWRPAPLFPSRAYGNHLLEAAMNRSAIVVALRAVKGWSDAVPRLGSYEHFYKHSNPQNAAVTRGQIAAGGYSAVVEALRTWSSAW